MRVLDPLRTAVLAAVACAPKPIPLGLARGTEACLAAHPRPAVPDPGLAAAQCRTYADPRPPRPAAPGPGRELLREPPAPVWHGLPRVSATPEEAATHCDPAAWTVSAEAAICVAGLPEGLEVPQAELLAGWGGVVWQVSVLTAVRPGAETRVGAMVDAEDGTVRHRFTSSVQAGRPFPAVAAVAHPGGPWLAAALAEHASVASFARHALELLALGAPTDLLDAVGEALRDEVAHAEACLRLAGGGAFGPLDTSAPPRAGAEAVLVALVREGCVVETLAAAEAAVAAQLATDPDQREVLATIARDEARHAALAWRTLAWGLGRFPEVRPAVIAALADRPDPPPGEAWGLLCPATRAAVAARAWRRVVVPAATALDPGSGG